MFLSILSGIAQMAVKQEQMCGRMTAMEEQTSSGTLPLWSYSEILFLQSILACLVVLQSTVIYWPTSWFVHQQIWKSKCHWRAEQLKMFQIHYYLLIYLIYWQYFFVDNNWEGTVYFTNSVSVDWKHWGQIVQTQTVGNKFQVYQPLISAQCQISALVYYLIFWECFDIDVCVLSGRRISNFLPSQGWGKFWDTLVKVNLFIQKTDQPMYRVCQFIRIIHLAPGPCVNVRILEQ